MGASSPCAENGTSEMVPLEGDVNVVSRALLLLTGGKGTITPVALSRFDQCFGLSAPITGEGPTHIIALLKFSFCVATDVTLVLSRID
jgi:hypothetical protein